MSEIFDQNTQYSLRYKMAPQPPISATSSAMAPPTMPAQSGVTYVVINQGASNNSMKPPTEPPPKRGRGRGRGKRFYNFTCKLGIELSGKVNFSAD